MVHNYSSYVLSEQEKMALLFESVHCITRSSSSNSKLSEFKQFYQRTFFNRHSLPQDDINKIKKKMKITCEKYSIANMPCKYRKIVNDLSRKKILL